MESSGIKEAISNLTRLLGFVDVGFAFPRRPGHYETFLSWLSDGHAAGMNYLGNERSLAVRRDPRLLLPECRSIIVLMARYPAPDVSGNRVVPQANGKVAAYAMGADYHKVLGEKLERLAAGIASLTGQSFSYRAFTDSVPVLERDMAFSAGLGWIGRNSCLISPEHGSYTFLAELLTDLPLEPDREVISDQCGNCHRCLDACPTHCIQTDRTIAAERCISYLTIENRGEVPYDLRPLLGNWIFGCDICQTVCPWNRKIGNLQVAPMFLASEHIQSLDLEQELSRAETEFKHIYQHSPILRARRGGFLRNIAIAIGNRGDPQSLDILLTVIHNEKDALIRAAAVWAIGRLKHGQIRQELLAIESAEKDVTVRNEIARLINEDK